LPPPAATSPDQTNTATAKSSDHEAGQKQADTIVDQGQGHVLVHGGHDKGNDAKTGGTITPWWSPGSSRPQTGP